MPLTPLFPSTPLVLGIAFLGCGGKDPGVNPFMILEECQRTTRFHPEEFLDLLLNIPVDVPAWKKLWLEASREAARLLQALPAEEAGCFYLDARANPATPVPGSTEFRTLRRHFGSVGGAWPVIRP